MSNQATRYRAVHQFHSGTGAYDAVTHNMLHIQGQLRSMGLDSKVFAEHVDPRLAGRIRPIKRYTGSDEELLIVHHSMGNGAFDHVVGLPNDIVAAYHNVTPEEYFEDPELRRYARLGRAQLGVLAGRAKLGLADSNYNRREMLAAGFRRVEVLPVRTSFATFAPPRSGSPRSRDWLFVGRVVANKAQHDVVAAFAAYARSFDPDARLILVGDTSQADYAAFVRSEAERLGVAGRVELPGTIPEADLASAYATAGVFVCLSEHEGFGVPLLEAMAGGLPVVALAMAAVPETMGGAGILLRTKQPATVAATVKALFDDAELARRLVERQLRRVRQVEAFDTTGLLRRVIAAASGEHQPVEVQVQGPFETSYSLAAMNRKLALALDQLPGYAVSIHATEGPGDYQPDPEDLARHPVAAALHRRSGEVPYPQVVVRQMWPPRVIDSPGAITCDYFGWEESRVPDDVVADFNRYVDGIGVMSRFVEDALRASGVDVAIRVVGNGVDAPDPGATVDAPELRELRRFRFLHISSAFPRKGVDVLLRAYFAAFDGRADVSLILKTFPNPHNEVAGLLAGLRSQHPDPPDVRWIDRDLSGPETDGLYNLAGCLVHPARGEGFGLPVAEAMAAGIPVISLAYSGLADFVSDTTALTVPYRIETARTHLDLEGSTWAEPDEDSLAATMRSVAERPDAPDILERVARARELISKQFSWEAAARRWKAFIEDLADGLATPKVALVSTWNSRCGIAEYSRYLVNHARDRVAFEVFPNTGVQPLDHSLEAGVTRTWADRWHPDLGALGAALEASGAEVVHFQFNFGFFELEHLAGLIDRLLERRGVVLTLHRTSDAQIDGEQVSLASISPTLKRVERLIVHQGADADLLAGMGLVDNVSVIPQGTPDPPPVSPAQVRQALGLGDRAVLGSFGFLLPHKGTLELVAAVDALRAEFPDLVLLALCALHPDPVSARYEETVRAEIAARGLQDHVLLVTEYLDDVVARAALRAADVIVLPYHPTPESASAALNFVLPAERPVVATDVSIFADARGCLRLVPPGDPDALEAAVREVLSDPDLRRSLSALVGEAARRSRWSRVAAEHRQVYVEARRSRRS